MYSVQYCVHFTIGNRMRVQCTHCVVKVFAHVRNARTSNQIHAHVSFFVLLTPLLLLRPTHSGYCSPMVSVKSAYLIFCGLFCACVFEPAAMRLYRYALVRVCDGPPCRSYWLNTFMRMTNICVQPLAMRISFYLFFSCSYQNISNTLQTSKWHENQIDGINESMGIIDVSSDLLQSDLRPCVVVVRRLALSIGER